MIRKYKVITLCGSTSFKDDFIREGERLTLEGNIVLQPNMFHHADDIILSEDDVSMLSDIHFRKIDMSDEIFVINKDGYIGESTKNEIRYAIREKKNVQFMKPIPMEILGVGLFDADGKPITVAGIYFHN